MVFLDLYNTSGTKYFDLSPAKDLNMYLTFLSASTYRTSQNTEVDLLHQHPEGLIT